MGETIEKIYCCDRDNNDNALAAAILANGNNRRDDWGSSMAAMMGGGMNNWMSNPFAYLMFLALFRNGGFSFGDGNGAGVATQEFSLIQGKATQVSFPRLEMNQKTGKTEMVVDVTIEANGKMATYTIPESHSVTYAGHLVLSTEKSGLTSEVEAQKANAEQVLASASKAQNIIDKAPSLLAELNPMYKEKQETEQRFGKIEKSISGMEELMKKQQEMMENFIKKFES